MDKIIYKNITINDNIILVVQALIDKQGEIVDWISSLSDMANDSNLFMKEKCGWHYPGGKGYSMLNDDVENKKDK